MKRSEMTLGAVLSFLSQAVSVASGLIFTPIVIRLLGQSEYGLYQLVLSVVNYLNLMNFGFSGAYIRYYSLAKKKGEEEVKKINGMFLTVFGAISFLCIVAGLLLRANLGILGEHLSASDYITAEKLVLLMVVNLAISFPNSLYVAYIFANERFAFSKTMAIMVNIILPLCKIPVLWMGYGSVGIVFITLMATLIQFSVNVWYCQKRLHMKIRYGFFDRRIFRDLFQFTFFIFLSDLVDQMNTNVDKLLLGRIIGTGSVAIYSVAFNLKHYYTILTWVVPEMFIPAVNRAVIEDNSKTDMDKLFCNVGRFNSYLSILVISGFAIFGKVFIQLWVGEEYSVSFYAALILLVSGYIPAVQTLGHNIQMAKNMHHMRSVIYFITACLNVAASVFLIKKWGVVGTCIGTLLAVLVGHGMIMNYVYHKRIGLDIISFWKQMIKWYPYAMVLAYTSLRVVSKVQINTWVELIAGIFVYVVIYVGLLFVVGLNKQDRQFVVSSIKR